MALGSSPRLLMAQPRADHLGDDMPDFSMCLDQECPSRVHCYRYRAKPNEYRQAYATYKHEGERCWAYTSVSGWDDFSLVPMSVLEAREKKSKEIEEYMRED